MASYNYLSLLNQFDQTIAMSLSTSAHEPSMSTVSTAALPENSKTRETTTTSNSSNNTVTPSSNSHRSELQYNIMSTLFLKHFIQLSYIISKLTRITIDLWRGVLLYLYFIYSIPHFRCGDCNKTFGRFSDLERHKRIHTVLNLSLVKNVKAKRLTKLIYVMYLWMLIRKHVKLYFIGRETIFVPFLW